MKRTFQPSPTRAQAPSRLPFAHGHQERPEDRRAPPRQGPQAPDAPKSSLRPGHGPHERPSRSIERLTKRPRSSWPCARRASALPAARWSCRAWSAPTTIGRYRRRLHRHPQGRRGGRAQPRQAAAARGGARPVLPVHGAPGLRLCVRRPHRARPTRPWARLLDDVKTRADKARRRRRRPQPSATVTPGAARPARLPRSPTSDPPWRTRTRRNTIIFVVCAVAMLIVYQFFVLQPAEQRRAGGGRASRGRRRRSRTRPRRRRPPRPTFVNRPQAAGRRARACRSTPRPLQRLDRRCAARRIDDLFLKDYRQTIARDAAAGRAVPPRGRASTPISPSSAGPAPTCRPCPARTPSGPLTAGATLAPGDAGRP